HPFILALLDRFEISFVLQNAELSDTPPSSPTTDKHSNGLEPNEIEKTDTSPTLPVATVASKQQEDTDHQPQQVPVVSPRPLGSVRKSRSRIQRNLFAVRFVAQDGFVLIPSLLPEECPKEFLEEIDWPPRSPGDGILEFGRLYKFKFV